jgi:hypothetical protein
VTQVSNLFRSVNSGIQIGGESVKSKPKWEMETFSGGARASEKLWISTGHDGKYFHQDRTGWKNLLLRTGHEGKSFAQLRIARRPIRQIGVG